MSTGISINNLHNAIFASPSKGRIKLLQSIGRLLRKNANKELAQVYDLYDDLSWKSSLNTTLRHFLDRLRIYQEQEFKYTIRKVKLDVSLEA
jgi:superfamily II DNA or RNA helicase